MERVRSISEKKLYSINQAWSSQRNILWPNHISSRQQLTTSMMSSVLDVWEGSEFASDFSNTQYLHYFLSLLYKSKTNLFVFSSLLRTCIFFNLQRGEYFLIFKKSIFRVSFLSLTNIYPPAH